MSRRTLVRLVVPLATLILAVSSTTVSASRASNSRPARGDARASASEPARARSGAPVRAGGRSSWRRGGLSHGHVSWGPYRTWGPSWPYAWGPYGGWGWWPGYDGPWIVREAPVYVFQADARDLPSAIETDVRPRKATVWLDGDEIGLAKHFNGTWDRLVVSPGRHTLEFRKDGYRTLRIDVDARPGQLYRIDRKLTRGDGPDPNSYVLSAEEATDVVVAEAAGSKVANPATIPTGLLRIDAGPADAAVYLDGTFLASAEELRRLHGALPVAVGRHRVEVVRPGFVARSVEIEVTRGETARVEIALEPR